MQDQVCIEGNNVVGSGLRSCAKAVAKYESRCNLLWVT